MEPVLEFLLKSAGLLTLFWLGYVLMLGKETFFTANRWYLLAGLVASIVLPLITITKTVWVDPMPTYDWALSSVAAAPEPQGINWEAVLFTGYGIGMGIFLISFAHNFISLQKVIRRQGQKRDGLRYIDTQDNVAPFSYLNCIVYNSKHYSEDELLGILEHERVHCKEKHSIDVLLMHLYCVVFWFNPIAWLYKKTAMQNLEFIADRKAIKSFPDHKTYQLTLLRVASDWKPIPISNPFFQSLIKKRIVMLNKSQSNQLNSLKYLFIVPLLAVFMLMFQVRVVAQERIVEKVVEGRDRNEVVVNKKTTDAQLKAEAERVKKEHGVNLKFSKVKRNAQGEITGIKAEYKSADGKKGSTQLSGQQPIAPLSFYVRNGQMGFGQPRGSHAVVVNGHRISPEDMDFHFDFNGMELGDIEIPEMEFEIPEPPAVGEGSSIRSKAKSKVFLRHHDGTPGIYINGDKIDIDGHGDGKTFTYSFSSDGDEDVVIVNGKRLEGEELEKYRPKIEEAKKKAEEAKVRGEEAMKRSEAMVLRGEAMAKRGEAMAKRGEAIANGNEIMKVRGHFFSDADRADTEKIKAELEKARAELEKARMELEKERAALEKVRAK